MNTFDLLETRRKHVRKYSDKIPDKKLIKRALWKAWKTTPSKNNAMAYEVLVWGPNKELEKAAIHSLVVKNHKHAEDRAVEKKLMNKTQGAKLGIVENPYYQHVQENPYLITIHSRIAKPNRFYEEQIKTGHFYDQAYNPEDIIDSVAVEVGIFAANLTIYLLEEGLDISYNSCFRRNLKEWHKIGLHTIKQRPITMISCGYAKLHRREVLKKEVPETWDVKPNYEDVVRWI